MLSQAQKVLPHDLSDRRRGSRIESTIRSTKRAVIDDFGGLRRSPRVCKSLKNLKAERCHAGGREFESRRSRQNLRIRGHSTRLNSPTSRDYCRFDE